MYVEGNPINYIDPSGYSSLAVFGKDSDAADWAQQEKNTVETAVWEVAQAYADAYNREAWESFLDNCEPDGGWRIPLRISAFRAFWLMHNGRMKFIKQSETKDYWGYTISSNEIWFYKNAVIQDTRFVTHELGHAFEQAFSDTLGAKLGRENLPANLRVRGIEACRPGHVDPALDCRGFAGQDLVWTYSRGDGYDGRGEIFADMFIGWVYNNWEMRFDLSTLGYSLTDMGQERKQYMDSRMDIWVYGALITRMDTNR